MEPKWSLRGSKMEVGIHEKSMEDVIRIWKGSLDDQKAPLGHHGSPRCQKLELGGGETSQRESWFRDMPQAWGCIYIRTVPSGTPVRFSCKTVILGLCI